MFYRRRSVKCTQASVLIGVEGGSSKFRRSTTSPPEAANFSFPAMGNAERKCRNESDHDGHQSDDCSVKHCCTGSTCRYGAPRRSGSTTDTGWQCVAFVTSSSSVVVKLHGRMAGTAQAAPFVTAVHVVVTHVRDRTLGSEQKRHGSPRGLTWSWCRSTSHRLLDFLMDNVSKTR